jgi:putative hemolysin
VGSRQAPGLPRLQPAAHLRLFDFSGTMEQDVLPYSVELGRSVVNREAAKAIMGLYCAWAGLGALTREYPHLESFFGNFSVYSSYPPEAIALLIRFLERHHRDPRKLLEPKAGLSYEIWRPHRSRPLHR